MEGRDSVTQDSSNQAAKQDMAASFIRRGWSVLILHDVAAGRCSCDDGADPEHEGSAGKHPRMGGGWQHKGMTDAEAVSALLGRYPHANLGILTGPASGMWVLDVDPKNGGDVLLAQLEAAYGRLPYTYTVRTGTGGTHYYFNLPLDFTPTSSRGRLPVGIDVRGVNGQVVAPGSRTLFGSYAVAVDAPLADAPAWLLEMIRPRAQLTAPSTSTGAYASELMSHDAAPMSSAEAMRLHAYAVAAVRQELEGLAYAPPGSRGSTAFKTACALIEIANSPWSGVDPALVWQAYLAAAEHAAGYGGKFSLIEAEKSWGSAQRRIGPNGRPAPAPQLPGGAVPMPTAPAASLPFDIVGAAPAHDAWGPTHDASALVGMVPMPRAPGEGLAAVPEPTYAQQMHAAAVDRQLDTLRVRHDAKARFDAEQAALAGAGLHERVAMLRARLLDSRSLSTIPRLKPLVDGWLMRDTLARVNGPSGHGKSFVMLDIAGCVATGIDWHGHATTQADVAYLVAEGAAGVEQRVRAWEAAHGREMTGVHFLPMPVQITDAAEWDALTELCRQLGVGLIVGDTQARLTVGVEENSATDMGLVVDALERMRGATGACVALVHHAGVGGDRARGSSAVKAALQTELFVSRDGVQVTVRTDKQKDHAEQGDLVLTMRAQDGTGSVALVREISITTGEPYDDGAAGRLIELCRESYAAGMGGTKGEIRAAYVQRWKISKSQFDRVWNKIIVARVMAKIHKSSSWIYVQPDDRPSLLEPVQGQGENGAFYAPVPVTSGNA